MSRLWYSVLMVIGLVFTMAVYGDSSDVPSQEALVFTFCPGDTAAIWKGVVEMPTGTKATPAPNPLTSPNGQPAKLTVTNPAQGVYFLHFIHLEGDPSTLGSCTVYNVKRGTSAHFTPAKPLAADQSTMIPYVHWDEKPTPSKDQ